jgi:uncharacterized protein YggE
MADNTNKLLFSLLFVAVVGLVIVAALRSGGERGQQQQNLLTVSGTHQLEVAPDQAVMTLQVLTNGTAAKDVSTENRQLLTQVMAALKAQGLTNTDIETTGVLLSPWTEWDPKSQTMIDKGYQQTTTLKVTVTDMETVGSVLDAAVNAGANSVQDISFELKPETEQRLKEQALADATADAAAKAQTLATAAHAHLGKVASLSEDSYIQPWVYNSKTIMDATVAGAAAPTPISPEKVTLQVSVSMAYELE